MATLLKSKLASVRLRLLFLVLVAVLPALVVVYYSARENREDARARVQDQALGYARISAIEYANSIRSSREFLIPIGSILSPIPDFSAIKPEQCGTIFSTLVADEPRFSFVGVVLPTGKLICGSGAEGADGVNFADEPAVQESIRTGEFAVARSAQNITGAAGSIEAVHPIRYQGNISALLVATINPASISQDIVSAGLPPGAFITIVSRDGVILARYPDSEKWVGTSVRDPQSFATTVARQSGSTREGTSLENIPVLVASVGLSPDAAVEDGAALGDTDAFVSVGIPRAEAYAGVNRQLRIDMMLIGAAGVVALVAAWVGSILFLRQIRYYSDATLQLATGNLDARTGPPYPGNELGELGRSIDFMATAVQSRDAEIRRLNEDLEQRVLDRTSELTEANAELESFSYSVSHDLRAPLRAIIGFARILTEDIGPSLNEESMRHLMVVQDNARQMGSLVDDLLAFSRLGRQSVERSRQSQHAIVERVIEEVLSEQEVRPEIVIGDLPDAMVDSRLVHQVWMNLISNAVKFSGKAEHPRIEIGSMQENGETAYFVRDNGVGFDMLYSDKLFGVFQRLHRAEDYEGTGVGLAIVQRIVQRHRGRVWADSKPGEGATFFFTIGKEAL
ncbi:hypothetical protein AYO38_06585 [bacterium SCGC AG-212-C10]|nr:hypothetical protein AYO38_06585 [bacterium SCGC AG-212-C10]